MADKFVTILLVLVATFLGSIGAIFLKKGSDKLSLRTIYKNVNLIVGVGFYGLSAIVFIFALSRGELSFVYPIVATSYVWASLMSVKFLGERMNVFKWIGIAIIIIGVSFIGIGG